MNELELNPCPFCGGEAKNYSKSQFWIGCAICGAELPICRERDEAVAAWNTRDIPDVATGQLVPAQTWQPISTAPRDTTEIVALCGRKDVRLGWYFAPSSRTFGWRDQYGNKIDPHHWMPLPAAPAPEVAE